MRRADIQGLRAFSITAVVSYHLFPTVISGGFLGVDVFFVISGYLITGQLVRAWEREGSLSIGEFYARRIRRILPLSALGLIAALLIVATLAPAAEQARNFVDIATAAVFSANWAFAQQVATLGVDAVEPSIVSHYWSLSIEEQFYLVWPLLIAALAWWSAHRRLPRGRARQLVAGALLLIVVVSLGSSVLGALNTAAVAYLETQSRVWALALGGLGALIPTCTLETIHPRLRVVASWIAGLLLVAAVIHAAPFAYSGASALAPTLATVVLLVLGEHESPRGPQFLARNRAVQWLGDRSFGVYVWHWIVLTAAVWLGGTASTVPFALAVTFISLSLAEFSKRGVEDPLRFGPVLGIQRRAFGVALSVTLLLAGCAVWAAALAQ